MRNAHDDDDDDDDDNDNDVCQLKFLNNLYVHMYLHTSIFLHKTS